SAQAIASGVSGGAIATRALAVPYRDGSGRPVLASVFEVDGNSLLEGGSLSEMPLQVFGYALDREGRVEDVFSLGTRLDLARGGARIRERGLQFHSTFALAPGSHDLRFLVRNGATGRAGALAMTVELPAFAPDSVVMAPPLFMDDPGRWLVVPVPAHSAA